MPEIGLVAHKYHIRKVVQTYTLLKKVKKKKCTGPSGWILYRYNL